MIEKMNNKYYEPTINEFYVGFEYESDGSGLAGGQEFFTKETIESPNNIVGVESMLFGGCIRVKYLDKEDIESLGWKFLPDDKGNGFHNDFFKYKIPYETRGDNFEKRMYLDVCYREGGNPSRTPIITISNKKENIETFFQGAIKNKSELKRLMKRIGLLRDSD